MGITIGLAVLMLALLIGLWGLRLRHRTGLPWAPVIYQDTGGHAPEKVLVARRLGLVGKPDYLLDIRGRIVPVEVKPGRRADRPYESDLMQLAAYCLLVEETSGAAPPYGLLRYAQYTFRLDYTEQIRADLLAMLDEMREVLADVDCRRSHDDWRRCANCGFYEQCTDALEVGEEYGAPT